MEYVDGHSLMDVISKMGMSEGQIAAVCREVRDLTCASDDLDRIVLWNNGGKNSSDFILRVYSSLFLYS